jgi:MoxR-like ATPase
MIDKVAAHQSPDATASRPQRPRRLGPRDELDVLIRARYPIIYVTSCEEERVEHCLREITEQRGKRLLTWTVTQGILASSAEDACGNRPTAAKTADPLAALDAVIDQVDPAVFLFKDFHPYTSGERCNISIIRKLRDAARHLRESYKTLVIVAPLLQLAPELLKDVTVIDFGLPRPRELSALLDRIVHDVRDNPQVRIDLNSAARERLLQAARGLTLKEAENVFARSLVLHGRLGGGDVDTVFSEKQQIVRKSGLLEYCDAHHDLAEIGGMNGLKEWLIRRGTAFGKRAAKFGLPAPRGMLLLGVQGCGKSLCAKAVAGLWKLPLLRLDIGRMFSSLVGSSEENIRRALQTAECVAPVVLWIDEIDKAVAGAGSAASDGGTAARVFGTLLTWLSEKTAPVFVVATANEIQHLPPELLRKGRLDEIFFVDLPSAAERADVFRIHLRKRGRDSERFDLRRLADVSAGFSGAEIEEAVIAGLFEAFGRRAELTTEMILSALDETVPLSQTMSEELDRLRTWSVGRARPASRGANQPPKVNRSRLEL